MSAYGPQTVKNASALRIDVSKGLIVNGTSAGGNFACILTQQALVDPEMKGLVTGQFSADPGDLQQPRRWLSAKVRRRSILFRGRGYNWWTCHSS